MSVLSYMGSMVRIIENWTDVEGVVVAIGPSPKVKGFCEAALKIEKVEDVDGYPNIIRTYPGDELVVNIARDLVREMGISVGVRLRSRVRRAFIRKVFVHPKMISLEGEWRNEQSQEIERQRDKFKKT